jgi:hypothetical protein
MFYTNTRSPVKRDLILSVSSLMPPEDEAFDRGPTESSRPPQPPAYDRDFERALQDRGGGNSLVPLAYWIARAGQALFRLARRR